VGDWNRDTDLVVADTVDAFVSVLLNASTSCSP